jgi:Tfp pilus assembly protein PilN
MIEINLLPGTGKKSRSKSAGVNFGGAAAAVASRVKDPYLLGAVASVLVAALAIGTMFWYQQGREMRLNEALRSAQQDSIRFASVVRQIELIKSFDNKRFVWPHLMDEISRALPPYTWVTSIIQTNQTLASAPVPANASKPADAKDGKSKAAADDSLSIPAVRFRLIGNTVDIQALTRFMKLLEASPFIENVQLVRSSMVIIDGKEVTEFQLDGNYQNPDPSAVHTSPVSLSVR